MDNEEVICVSRDEGKNALKRMKKGKAVGSNELPVEVWKCMGEMGIKFLTRLFNRLLMGERMPEEWRRSVLIPIYKNKRDAQCCENYREIKLMSHTMKVWERIIETRLRDRVEITKHQYGFIPGKETTDDMFALRMLIEKYEEGQRELHCVVATNQLARAKDSCDKRRRCASMRENAYYDFVRAFFVRAFIIKSALLETGHVSRSQIVCLVSERCIGDPGTRIRPKFSNSRK